METLAYLQVAQEVPENKELTLEALNALKLSGKFTGTLLGAAGVTLAVGGLTNAPAQAHGYGYDYCGYDYCGGIGDVKYLGGGYQVTSYKTYDVSYKKGCYDDCYSSYYPSGCYDDCYSGVSYYPKDYCYDDCYSGISYYPKDYCYDDCYGGVSYSYGGCYDYCGISYGGYSTYDIQIALTYAGFHVAVDGIYGPETYHAVVAFQHAVGLAPDGIVGPATAHALGL